MRGPEYLEKKLASQERKLESVGFQSKEELEDVFVGLIDQRNTAFKENNLNKAEQIKSALNLIKKNVIDRINKLEKNFAKMDCSGLEGEVAFEKNGYKFEIAYDDPWQKKAGESLTFTSTERKGAKVKRLAQFGITDMKTKKELDIFNYVPHDHEVIFSPELSWNQSYYDHDAKIIFFGGTPTNSSSILALFHEIGHVNDFLNKDKDSIEFSNESLNMFKVTIDESVMPTKNKIISEENLAEVLRQERAAHAFLIRTLRPYIKAFGLKETDLVDIFVHLLGLSTYSPIIKERLKRTRSVWGKKEQKVDEEEVLA